MHLGAPVVPDEKRMKSGWSKGRRSKTSGAGGWGGSSAVVASGDDSIAAGNDVTLTTNVDQSTNFTADGDITETDRESDPEDVQKAKEAEVTAQQALDTAREGRDGVTLDEMDLDDDNGTLQWEVGFDREDGSDGPEVEIDARSGEVLTVDEH